MNKKYSNPKDKIPLTGDWVRFYRNAEMIIASVQYIAVESKYYPCETQLQTDRGAVYVSDVLEAR